MHCDCEHLYRHATTPASYPRLPRLSGWSSQASGPRSQQPLSLHSWCLCQRGRIPCRGARKLRHSEVDTRISVQSGGGRVLLNLILFCNCRKDGDVNILYGEGGGIKAASFPRLIVALTDESSSPAFRKSFLLTYRSFTTPMDLMRALEVCTASSVQRPDCSSSVVSVLTSCLLVEVPLGHIIQRTCSHPSGWNPEGMARGTRMGCYSPKSLSFLLTAASLQEHFYDFASDTQLTDQFMKFVDVIGKSMKSVADQLIKVCPPLSGHNLCILLEYSRFCGRLTKKESSASWINAMHP